MELLDNGEILCKEYIRDDAKIGLILKDVLDKAIAEQRVTYGVFACAKKLKSNPDSVSLCILLDVNPIVDVAVHIQHKLIEAYCWENEIAVIKVNSDDKLELLCSCIGKKNVCDLKKEPDFNCLLIECQSHYPEVEDTIEKFCQVMNNDYPQPNIDLPI